MSRFRVLRVQDGDKHVGYMRRGGITPVLSLGTAYSAPSAVKLATQRAQKRFPMFTFVPVDWMTGRATEVKGKR